MAEAARPGDAFAIGNDEQYAARLAGSEALIVAPQFLGRRPVFVTIARTTGPDQHTDVSLWYLLAGRPALPIALDPREFAGGRWWTGPQLESADPALLDPNMGRFLAKIRAQPRA